MGIVDKKVKGFTIVELIVVIGVIGILAGITVVGYGAWRTTTTQNQLKSDLNGVASSMETARNFGDTYPATVPSTFTPSSGVVLSGGGMSSGKNFCVTATQNSLSYRATNYSTPRPGTCSGPGRDDISIIKWASWTLGTGGVAGYGLNGDGNSRITDTNPWGVSDTVWDVSNQDALSDADGGWNGSSFAINNTKMYRFSTFIKRKTIGNGSTYLGTHGYPSAVLNRSNGVSNANPYFSATGWWGSSDQWYLVIGHVWPAGSGAGAAMADSGIYTLSGTKITPNSDYVWQSTTTSSDHRSYLYYSTDVATNQQWYQPRVDVVDGTEPTISELLNDTF
ncbi:prepilin-type N-terminal cleavage/methylation domain-containing protein [Candidatus Saccharibacteria bacterium]|nr:prepilin-type N-terminal cleavage/methylation domain-containing protein [Candidatus Saccharibacteria bacterium]